jgi:AraC-like DNA-binding protein
MYQEHAPNIILMPFVETYWTTIDDIEKETPFKVLPDGCVDIVFNLNESVPDIVGTMTTALELTFSGKVRMFGIRFRPAAITAFTRVPVQEFTDRMIDISLLETVFDRHFYESLQEHCTVENIVNRTNNYLISKLSSLYKPEKQVLCAVDLIYSAKGNISLADVASDVCLCQRHFERKFKSAVGISPKTFAKVVRFKNALHYLKKSRGRNNDLFSIAISCGYYDHTHLIKDFKMLSGEVPAYFRK